VHRPDDLAGAFAHYDIIAEPMIRSLPEGSKMIATGVISPFLVPMKVTLVIAIILALPWVLYQLWAFVAPGLYAHEKRLIAPLVISSSVLFMAGVAFCYFLVFGRVFQFIAEFSPQSIAVTPDIENYLDFVMSMCLAFGATFEVPVVVVILVRMGLVSVAKLKEIRPYAIVGAFVIAAIVTPPDAVSMFSLAIPMCLLFELGLLVAPVRPHLHRPRRKSLKGRRPATAADVTDDAKIMVNLRSFQPVANPAFISMRINLLLQSVNASFDRNLDAVISVRNSSIGVLSGSQLLFER
jgi:sec-independent protein translocase protein TatC